MSVIAAKSLELLRLRDAYAGVDPFEVLGLSGIDRRSPIRRLAACWWVERATEIPNQAAQSKN